VGKNIAWAISLLLLFFTGFVGIYNAANEWHDAATPLQRSVTVGVFLYGILGLVTAYGLIRRRRWSLRTAIGWGLCVTYVPGVAVLAYGGDDAFLGSAIAASVGAALIASFVIWTTNIVTRHLPSGTVRA
jgi:hypothetical membrane protein